MAIKLGIIVGHTAAKPGAQGVGIEAEYRYNKAMAKDMLAYAKKKYSTGSKPVLVKIFLRDDGGVSGAYGRADDWKADYTAELHYNSVGNTSVRGTETLSSGTVNSMAFAKAVQQAHCGILGRGGQSRGIKVRNRQNKDRGWFSLVAGNAPAIITEPAFGSSPQDAMLLDEHHFKLGRAIVDSVRQL
jgi:N-acetylmuramoyl-L-alanine amidase